MDFDTSNNDDLYLSLYLFMLYDKCSGDVTYEECFPPANNNNSSEEDEDINTEQEDSNNSTQTPTEIASKQLKKDESSTMPSNPDYLLNKAELKKMFSESDSVDDADRFALLSFVYSHMDKKGLTLVDPRLF